MKNTNKKGFSLVELVIVIAVMAVLTAVLVPALLLYVEKSRAQKDASAMSELSNAIILAMAEQEVYDEMIYYTTCGNISCYIDKSDEQEIGLTRPGQYIFDDNTRIQDETTYYGAGNMRGVTLTFVPEKQGKQSVYHLKDTVINKFVSGRDDKIAANRETNDLMYIHGTPDYETEGTIGTTKEGKLYNKLRSIIGDTVVLTSQTYRNSEYTIFLCMSDLEEANNNPTEAPEETTEQSA